MARTKLRTLNGQRLRFRATVHRRGTAPGWKDMVETVMLKDVVNARTNESLTDHIWFKCGKWAYRLNEGSVIEFDARVGTYTKGYYHDEIDYHLLRPTKLEFVGGTAPLDIPDKTEQNKSKENREIPPSSPAQRRLIQSLQGQAAELLPQQYSNNPAWSKDPATLNVKEASDLIDQIMEPVNTEAKRQRTG